MKLPLRRLLVLLLLLAGVWSGPCIAHESQPGLLEIRQLTTERWEVVWRAPIYYGKSHPARLALPPDWQPIGEPTVQRLASADLHRQIVEGVIALRPLGQVRQAGARLGLAALGELAKGQKASAGVIQIRDAGRAR